MLTHGVIMKSDPKLQYPHLIIKSVQFKNSKNFMISVQAGLVHAFFSIQLQFIQYATAMVTTMKITKYLPVCYHMNLLRSSQSGLLTISRVQIDTKKQRRVVNPERIKDLYQTFLING